MMSSGAVGRRQYRTVGVHRGNKEEGEEAKHELRIIDTYKPIGKEKLTDFFSTISPEELLGEIHGYFTDLKGKVTVDPKKYKMSVVAKYIPKEEKDDEDMDEG